jgi:thioredoxin 1
MGGDMPEIINTTDSNFDNDISIDGKLVVVDMWAEWCGPCKMMEPVLEEIINEKGDSVQLVKINIDENQETPVKYGVMNIPTLLFFKEGKEVGRVIGAVPKKQLEKKIEDFL